MRREPRAEAEVEAAGLGPAQGGPCLVEGDLGSASAAGRVTYPDSPSTSVHSGL